MRYKVSITIEKDDDGYFAWCPALEGCQTQGDTLDEAMANIREAIAVYLDSLPEEDRSRCVDSEVINATIEVEVA